MASPASPLIIPHLRPQLHHYTTTKHYKVRSCNKVYTEHRLGPAPLLHYIQQSNKVYTGWVPGFWIGGPARLNTRITSDDITEMYFQSACTVFVAKDPFYVRGHHPMRRSGSKRADLTLIGFSAPGNLVKHLGYFVQTSIHDRRQFQMTSNQ